MTIIEIGALTSALLAVITLTGKIIKLITTIQSLISSIDSLEIDTIKNKELWDKTNQKYQLLDQRLTLIEYEVASE